MRKILLYSSALALLSGVAEAACIQTPSCSSLGYESTSSCSGGLKCPFGNAWNCTLVNKITELEKTIEKNQAEEALKNCKIGDILYSDFSCNANMVATKKPIGVVFDTTNGLAIAKDEVTGLAWGSNVDISGIQNYSSSATAVSDWQGFNNTKAIYEYRKTKVSIFPAVEKALAYSTEGTSKGQWYLPAAGELKAISDNKDVLNTTLSKIGGQTFSNYLWASSEVNSNEAFYFGSSSISSGSKSSSRSIRPVINFISKDKIDVGAVPCNVGDILYSDKKCYLEGFTAGKTPIGVVFDSSKKLAIGLQQSFSFQWSAELFDILKLSNITSESAAIADWQGKNNTKVVFEYCKANGKSCPAFEYVNSYKTEGTQAGDWYLPSMGELNAIHDNGNVLDAALSKIGGTQFSWGMGAYYWSSSEYSGNYAWKFDFCYNIVSEAAKNSEGVNGRRYYVRPVLAF